MKKSERIRIFKKINDYIPKYVFKSCLLCEHDTKVLTESRDHDVYLDIYPKWRDYKKVIEPSYLIVFDVAEQFLLVKVKGEDIDLDTLDDDFFIERKFEKLLNNKTVVGICEYIKRKDLTPEYKREVAEYPYRDRC